MILVKYSKFLSSLFFLQKRPRLCRFMIMFSPNESFWTIKISRYYGRKICIFSKGLTHDSCQKFQLPLETYFSVKETSVFSFDDVVLSKGGFLDNKIVNVRGQRCRNIFENISRYAWIKMHFFTADYSSFGNSYNAKFKIQLVQQMNLKVFKVSPKTPNVITQKREARITDTAGKFTFKLQKLYGEQWRLWIR